MSAFRIAGTNEDAVCGFYVALLANAAGEAVLHADTGDGRVVSTQTRCPDELCTWLEGAAGEHGDAYGSLRTSDGEVVGVRRVSPRGTELVRPVPPSIELVTRSDRLVEIWLFRRAASHDHPILRALQARLDPEVGGDERVLVPIPGVPAAEAALLTPANPDELYDRAIPYCL